MAGRNWTVWAGWAAGLGGLVALVLTPPFATAYFLSYGVDETAPFWIDELKPRVRSWAGAMSPFDFYNRFGRVYDVVYLLMIPAFLVLHDLHRHLGSRLESRGFRAVMFGLVASFLGVAGDYWADGVGFPVEMLGLLVLALGSTAYGIALVRARVVPSWCGWMLVGCAPATVVAMFLVGHLPSGPTLPLAIVCVPLGFMLVLTRNAAPSTEQAPPGTDDQHAGPRS